MVKYLLFAALVTGPADTSQNTPTVVIERAVALRAVSALPPTALAPNIGAAPAPRTRANVAAIDGVRPDTTHPGRKKRRNVPGDHLLVSLTHSEETFTTSHPSWRQDEVSVRLNASGMAAGRAPASTKENTLRRTVIAFEGGRAERFGQHQAFGGIDYYRTIVTRTYANLRLRFAPRAVVIPEFDVLLDLTSGTSTGWEASAGYRLMRYKKSSVNLFSASGARYYGLWYFRSRVSLIPISGSLGTSVVVSARRYFRSGEELVEFVVSSGREVVTGSANVVLDIRQSVTGLVRGQYFLTQSIGLQGGASYTSDAGLSRWGLTIGILSKI